MPTIVIDSNLILHSIIDSPESEQMARLWAKWQVDDAEISAPSLWQYEVTSVLHRLLHSGQLTAEEAQQLLETAMAFEVQSVEVDKALCAKAFEWATRLQTAPAYDSFYLALAERLQAEFWTGERRLANNAQSHGAAWVRWIGESYLADVGSPPKNPTISA